MKSESLISRIANGFCKVEKTITWILFSVMLALLLIQVICRYVFHLPLAWAEEMVRYTYIAVSFIGAIIAVREKSHITIDILPTILESAIKDEGKSERALFVMALIAEAIQVVFFAIITLWLIQYNIDIMNKHQITTANEWPMWIMCLPVTISFALMTLHAVFNIIEDIGNERLRKKGGMVLND